MSAACVIALFLSFLMLTGTCAAVAGFPVLGDKLIEPGHFCALPIVMATDGPLEFSVEVHSGPDIDIILIAASELNDFNDGRPYTYYPGGTFSDRNEADGYVYLDAGTYYLILKNDGSRSASVHYTFTPTAFSTDSDDDWSTSFLSSTLMIVMIAIIVAIAILALIIKVVFSMDDDAQKERTVHSSSNPIICKGCGEQNSDDAKYCKKCGSKIR